MIVQSNSQCFQLLTSHPVLLLSTRRGRSNNLAPVTWYAPIAADPPMIGLSLKPSTESFRNLRESGDFILAAPTVELLRTVHFCGIHSGRDMDKMRIANLSVTRGKAVSPLLLTGCAANIECRVRDILYPSDRPWITGEVLSVTANPHYFDGVDWTEAARLIHHVRGNRYRAGGESYDLGGDIHPGYVPPDHIVEG